MSNRRRFSKVRVLAIAPSSKGVGFAVIEEGEILADWGLKRVDGADNDLCLRHVGKLMSQYQPGVFVLEDYWAKESKRSERIKKLGERFIALAKSRRLKTKLISRKRVFRFILGDEAGTRYGLAETLAKRFPEELSFRLPPKRRPWMSDDARMSIFQAVALAVAV